jgi:DNA-binding transcriptional regulator YdaS (Cro superfamily)
MDSSGYDALVLAVAICGSQKALAHRLGKHPSVVWNWLHRDGLVPLEHVARVVDVVDDPRITPFTLRPDFDDWRLLAVQLVRADMGAPHDGGG